MLAQPFTIGNQSDPATPECFSYTCLFGDDEASLLLRDLPVSYMLKLGAQLYEIPASQLEGCKMFSFQEGNPLRMLHLHSQIVNKDHACLLMTSHQTKGN